MLKYSEAVYQGKIDQLTEYITMLEGHTEKLQEYRAQLAEFWDDNEGEQLGKMLVDAITKTNNQLFYLRQQLAFYKKMVTEYGGASAEVQQGIENALQAISSVGGIAALM